MRDGDWGDVFGWRPWLVVAGGALVHATIGGMFVLNNLQELLVDYLNKHSSHHYSAAQAKAIVATQVVCFVVGIGVGSWLSSKLGARATTLIGGWTMSGALVAVSFLLSTSLPVVAALFGGMTGLGMGVAYTSPLRRCMQWFPNAKGATMGFVVSGLGFSVLVVYRLRQLFPLHGCIQPYGTARLSDTDEENDANSTDHLDEIPRLLLGAGIAFAIAQCVGALSLLCPVDDQGQEVDPSGRAIGDITMQLLHPQRARSPSTLLVSRRFWLLFTAHALNLVGITCFVVHWPEFAKEQSVSSNTIRQCDVFGMLFQALGCVWWGHLTDSVTGPPALFLLLVLSAGLQISVTWAHDIGGEKLLFFWVVGLAFCYGGQISAFLTTVVQLFGSPRFGGNYAMLSSAQALVVGVFVCVVGTSGKGTLGWTGLFGVYGGCCGLAAMFALLLLRATRRG